MQRLDLFGIASASMVLLAVPAFCFAGIAIIGYAFGAVLFGIVSAKSLAGLGAALALSFLSVFGPTYAQSLVQSDKRRWLWALSPVLPFAVLIILISR